MVKRLRKRKSETNESRCNLHIRQHIQVKRTDSFKTHMSVRKMRESIENITQNEFRDH